MMNTLLDMIAGEEIAINIVPHSARRRTSEPTDRWGNVGSAHLTDGEWERFSSSYPGMSCVTPGEPYVLHCFPSFKTGLTREQLAHLDIIAEKIRESFSTFRPISKVTIVGHSSTWYQTSRNTLANRALQRANNAREQLLERLGRSNLAHRVQVNADGRSDAEPWQGKGYSSRSSNSQARNDRALNRRVEIRLLRGNGQSERVRHPELGLGIRLPSLSRPDVCRGALEMSCAIERIRSCFFNGADNRVPVTDTTVIPHRWICEIMLLFQHPLNKSLWAFAAGSGLLVSKSHILTSAHMLHQRIDFGSLSTFRTAVAAVILFGFSSEIGSGKKVFPFAPIIQKRRSAFRVPEAWKKHIQGSNSEPERYDFGVISLKGAANCSPRYLDMTHIFPDAFWGAKNSGTRIAAATKGFLFSKLKNAEVKMAGYPADMPCQQWNSKGPLTRQTYGGRRSGRPHYKGTARNDSIRYQMDSGPGMSGSPVWGHMTLKERSGVRREERVLIGVHSRCGRATVITPFVWEKQLKPWMERM